MIFKTKQTSWKFLAILLLTISNFSRLPAQNIMLFVGSFNWDKTKEGLYVFELDSITGQLTKRASLTDIVNPSFLAISPDGRTLYSVTESKTPGEGSVSSYRYDHQNKTLQLINNQKTGSENPVYIALHKSNKWLLSANYTDSSITVFPLQKDGSIAPKVQNLYFFTGSVNKKRQRSSHLHSVAFSAEQNSVFAADLGADTIRQYRFDEAAEKYPIQPMKVSGIKTDPGSGPRHLLINNNIVYCIEEMGGNITVYSNENNTLNKIQTISAHHSKIINNYESSDLHLSPDGKFLYATNRGKENNIAIYSVLNDGQLKFKAYQSTKGKHPRTFAIDPTGNFVFVANTLTSNLSIFRRNKVSGLLQLISRDNHVENISHIVSYQFPIHP